MASENITLEEAVSNVDILNDLITKSNIPCIEASSLPLQCLVNFDTNFEDKGAFVTGFSKFIEEAARHGEFNDLLNDGFKYAGILYTWRCCTRATPMAKSNDQPNRNQINEKIIEVLTSEVEKLHRFMNFTKTAVSRFCEEVRRLCAGGKIKDFVSEAYLLVLGRFLNMFAVLDELKNMKASIKNDFSTFRRAAQFLQVMSNSQSIQQMQELSMFLATQNKIKEDLKKELQMINGYEELLSDIINICVYLFENQMYGTPDERHMFVKVIAFSLYLMGSPNSILNKLDSKKRISIASIDKIFKTLNVVPLFGDMQIQPFSFVRRCASYDSSKWPLSHKESTICQVDIVERAKVVREHYVEYVTHLTRVKNEIESSDKHSQRSDYKNQEVAQLALSGIQLLCTWTSDVVETVSWKLLHPTNEDKNKECPSSAEEYERATRYNYNGEEKNALIEMIAMIKGLQRLLVKQVGQFMTSIRLNVYAEIQDFVQITLKEPLIKAIKGKKDMIKGILMAIVETCIDNISGNYNQTGIKILEMAKSKNKKKSTSVEALNHVDNPASVRRNVPPSTTQLYMARTMLESLISERCSNGRRGLRKDIDHKHIEKMISFLRISFYWPYLLNFEQYLFECCDLSQLWFREFYLEMTMGKRIQFPIEMSFPWILTDHILTNPEQSHLMQYILYQLDLYNDAANFALTKFKTQFLYDEVEAEVNLCFDQFIFKLSEAVFTHYKQVASSYLLDKQFKTKCNDIGVMIRSPEAARFEPLLKQRHLQLLGRSIDINRLVSQRINISILHSLDVAISKFESEPLIGIIRLEFLLEVNRYCYDLLKQQLFSLSDFDDLFVEANGLVSSDAGRIGLHIFFELNYDIFPNYCYNTSTNRFVRGNILFKRVPERIKASPCNFQYEFGSRSLGAAAENIAKMHSGYIGYPHLRAIVRLLGYQGIAVILKEFTALIHSQLTEKLRKNIEHIMHFMPKICKLPLSTYGSPAVLEYYLHHTKEVRNYKDLYTGFGQQLRIFGNVIIFTQLLESALQQEEVLDLSHGAAFTFNVPRTGGSNMAERQMRSRKIEIQFESLHFTRAVNVYGTPEQVQVAQESELLTKERLCVGLNIFEHFLQYTRSIVINDTLYTGSYPKNGVMTIDECTEFHRLWSAIQFIICLPSSEHDNNINDKDNKNDGKLRSQYCEEMFGDGPHWGSCILIAILGQEKRFNVLDFSYHLKKIHRSDSKNPPSNGIDLSKMITRIRHIQQLNNEIFTFLRSFLPSKEDCGEYIREYSPPQHASISHSSSSNYY
uniref:Cytoplasmic FMR1-interacting protein n=1 Tax=Strongyloides stercoralis TaxID=6248 RepID=A0A0K0ENA6_STRER